MRRYRWVTWLILAWTVWQFTIIARAYAFDWHSCSEQGAWLVGLDLIWILAIIIGAERDRLKRQKRAHKS